MSISHGCASASARARRRSTSSSVVTVADLLNHLKTLGEEYETALQYPEVIRVALDMEHVEHDEPIGAAREIGIFPPMTGG